MIYGIVELFLIGVLVTPIALIVVAIKLWWDMCEEYERTEDKHTRR